MALKRQFNFLGQQRIEVPHLRSMESAVAADFDDLAGKAMAGQTPLVLKGFELVTATALASPASSLQMIVAGAVMLHPTATEAGTVFAVSDEEAAQTLSAAVNGRVSGAFAASSTNYVLIDLVRTVDSSTADLMQFLEALTFTEQPRTVPLARVLDFRIVITTVEPSALPHLCPVAKVVTDAGNAVSAITDIRPMMFRLASGGAGANIESSFGWSGGRQEGTTSATAFDGGDKVIGSLKQWQDAVMTRLWELGGGDRWYSASSDREVKLVYGQPVLGNGDNFQWTLGTDTVEWTSLQLAFCNSPATYNTITNGTETLLDGECLYVDVDRSTEGDVLTMQRGVRANLGAPSIPGSRVVIAWRRGSEVFFKDKQYEAGRSFVGVASPSATGTVKLRYAAGNPADPIVNPVGFNGAWTNEATAGNTTAILGIGFGTGAGVRGVGGDSAGARGVIGQTSAANGDGVFGQATSINSNGVFGTSTDVVTGGTGVKGTAALGTGVRGEGGGAGAGVVGVGGATNGSYGVTGQSAAVNGNGVRGVGAGTGTGIRGEGGGDIGAVGVEGIGGPTGTGVVGVGGSGSGIGTEGYGTGTGAGVKGTGGATAGSGVEGTGGVNGTGVVGLGGTGNGTGVSGGATGLGVGVQGTSSDTAGSIGVSGAVFPGASTIGVRGTAQAGAGAIGVQAIGGPTGLALQANVQSDSAVGGVEINAPNGSAGTTAAINNSTDLLKLRNLRNVNGSICMISMLHADATSARDGWAMYSERIADGDVDLFFRPISNGVFIPDTGLKFDRDASRLLPMLGSTHGIGSAAAPFLQVVSKSFVTIHAAAMAVAGTGVDLSVSGKGIVPLTAAGAGNSITSLSGGENGQEVTLINTSVHAIDVNSFAGADQIFIPGGTHTIPASGTFTVVRHDGRWYTKARG